MPECAAASRLDDRGMRVGQSLHACSSRRKRRRGQGLVEFALVAPVFFFLIFALIDGGFLLYTVNTVDQTATIGANSIAGQGRVDTTDFTALQKMAAAGLTTTALVNVQEIDVEELNTNATGDGFLVNADGSPQVATNCGSNGTTSCIDQYKYSGSGGSATVVLLNGNSSGCPDNSGCPPWPPSARNVSNGSASFVGLKITYTYNFFTHISGSFTLTTLKTFRLEPEA
jgi:Flp pilus assembly protein TadG